MIPILDESLEANSLSTADTNFRNLSHHITSQEII